MRWRGGCPWPADGPCHAGETDLGRARREQRPDRVARLGAAGHDVVNQQHRSGADRLARQVAAGGGRQALRGAHAHQIAAARVVPIHTQASDLFSSHFTNVVRYDDGEGWEV